MLTLSEETVGTVRCTSLCLDRPENVLVNSKQSMTGNIFSEVTLQGIVNSDSLSSHNSSSGPYSLAFNISWTDDLDLRERLNELQCIFTYMGGAVCNTNTIVIVFSGK